jgi:hypothetical protein
MSDFRLVLHGKGFLTKTHYFGGGKFYFCFFKVMRFMAFHGVFMAD